MRATISARAEASVLRSQLGAAKEQYDKERDEWRDAIHATIALLTDRADVNKIYFRDGEWICALCGIRRLTAVPM